MDASIFAQRDFSAGQVDQTTSRGDDTEIMRAGLRIARNVRVLNTRALTRRPGRRRLFATTGIVEVIRPAVGEFWTMALEAGRVVLRNQALTQTVVFGSMPWTQAMLSALSFEVTGGNVIIAHQAFRPRVLTYNATLGTWSASIFAFTIGQNGAVRQPFRNYFPGQKITMRPSARAGAITLTFSAPVLQAGHAGVVFLYGGFQIRVDSVVSSTVATATVLQELPPTYRVTLASTSGFQVDDLVEGLQSGAIGTVVAVTTTSLDIVVTKIFTGFIGLEKIVGPRASLQVAGQAAVAPAASFQWEEALVSPVRGWPGAVCTDSQRLIFANFQQYGPGIVWSAVGTLNDFLVGVNADDAISDYVPENCQILHVAGGADEFVLTDTGVFYVPISASNPLRPGSVEFRRVSNDAAGPARPRMTSQGLVYVNSGATRVMAVVSTGQTAAPYIVEDLTQFHADLIKTPVAISYTPSDSKAPERYLYAVNGADGTLAVARFERQKNWVGWVAWDGMGDVVWTSSGGPMILMTVAYAIGGTSARYAEVLDDDLLLDGTVDLVTMATSSPLELSAGVPLELTAGNPLVLSGGYALAYAAGATVSIVQDGWYRGDYDILENGDLSGSIPISGLEGLVAGFRFVVEVEPFVPHANEGPDRKQRMRKRRIKHGAVVVQRSQALEVAGRLVPYWRAGEEQESAPPLRDETYRFRKLGRDWDPRWSVRQELPGALTIVEMTTQVTI